MLKNEGRKVAAIVVLLMIPVLLLVQGCGQKEETTQVDDTQGRPESVTAFEAVEYTKPAAKKWYEDSWTIRVKSGDPDGITSAGKAKVWEVYFFSPTPEEECQLYVIYNRGRVWPSVPTRNKGGVDGKAAYKKNKPPEFRVDSNEAYAVAVRNGGGDFKDAHQDTRTNVFLRCKGDYEASGSKMPAPKYEWIWDVSFSEPKLNSEILHIYVDGMNGDYITKEVQKPPA
jgi:hypothetical protein